MILRDVVVAGERRLLGAQDSPTASLRTTLERRTPLLEVVSTHPSASPPLTAERVCEWLATQSEESRLACARALSKELEAVAHDAHSQGLEIGRSTGRQEVEAQAGSALAALATMVSAIENVISRESTQLAESCAEIVCAAFTKIAGTALIERDAVLQVVLQVLSRVKNEAELSIRVSPTDLPILQSYAARLDDALGGRHWTLIPDTRVSAGGCMVESSSGTLNGTLESQLHGLLATLRAAKKPQDPP
jgi:flagellar biosynthesis/type III secretory pathway protein FliH